MPTILQFTDEKTHSVRYDYKGEDFHMTVYVPKAHPVFETPHTWPQTLKLELTDPKADGLQNLIDDPEAMQRHMDKEAADNPDGV